VDFPVTQYSLLKMAFNYIQASCPILGDCMYTCVCVCMYGEYMYVYGVCVCMYGVCMYRYGMYVFVYTWDICVYV